MAWFKIINERFINNSSPSYINAVLFTCAAWLIFTLWFACLINQSPCSSFLLIEYFALLLFNTFVCTCTISFQFIDRPLSSPQHDLFWILVPGRMFWRNCCKLIFNAYLHPINIPSDITVRLNSTTTHHLLNKPANIIKYGEYEVPVYGVINIGGKCVSRSVRGLFCFLGFVR